MAGRDICQGLLIEEGYRVDLHLDACDHCRELVDFVIADELEAPNSIQVSTFQRGFVVA